MHQIRSYYVMKNAARLAQTVCKLSGRSSNFLRSVYEFHGRARAKLIENGVSEPDQNFQATISQCGNVLKRDGLTPNRFAVLGMC